MSCAGRVNTALASLPWVEKHEVDFGRKEAHITVNGKFDKAATLKAITDLGFGATVKKVG